MSQPQRTPSDLWNLQLPPQDKESERALLGSILNNANRLFDVRALLDEGDIFYDNLLGDLYRTMLSVSDSGTVLRPLTVNQKLIALGRNDILRHAPLFELTSESAGCEPVSTALHLRELYIKRLAMTKSAEIISAVRDNQLFDAVMEKCRELAATVSGKTSISGSRSMAQVTRSSIERMKAAAAAPSGLSGVNTGSGKLNQVTGGWQTSDVVVFAARPGVGKTVVLLHHAKHAAISGVPTGFMSLEIDSEQCSNRLISSECLIPYSDLLKGKHRDGRPFTNDDWRAIEKAADYINSLPIYFYEGGSTDINDLMYWSYDMQQRHGVGLFALDYLQKAKDRTVRGGSYEMVSSISGKIKDANLKMRVPILAGSQLNRGIEHQTRTNKRPQLDDLRESGKIEEDASIVGGGYRDDYYKLKKAKDDMAKGQPFIQPEYDHSLEWDILKNRNGEVGMVKLWIDVKTNRIFDEEPNYVPKPQPEQLRWTSNYPDGAATAFIESAREKEDSLDIPF